MHQHLEMVEAFDKGVSQVKSDIIPDLRFHLQLLFTCLQCYYQMAASHALRYILLLAILARTYHSSQLPATLPVTHNSPPQRTFEYLILQSQCVQKYKHHGAAQLPLLCYAYTLSQFFNIILIPICLFLKVPQILVIARNKSVYGLSFLGNNLELLMTSMTLAYGLHANFSFWIYGQNIILSIQNMIIISMFFQFPPPASQTPTKLYLKSLLLPVISTIFVSSLFVLQIVPDWCQQASIWLQLLVFIGARGSQIINNFKYKTVQNVSLKTYAITLFANFARTFTILIESPESLGYLLNYLIPIFVNGTLVLQILSYGKKIKSQ